MGGAVQIVLLTFTGIFLLWFGYTLFTRFGSARRPRRASGEAGDTATARPEGLPGAPRTCPLCSVRLVHGERVRSAAFPSMDGKERMMHVMGCPYCLDTRNARRRACPVCGAALGNDDYLIARMFERPGRSHVHVLGCTRCRGPRSNR